MVEVTPDVVVDHGQSSGAKVLVLATPCTEVDVARPLAEKAVVVLSVVAATATDVVEIVVRHVVVVPVVLRVIELVEVVPNDLGSVALVLVELTVDVDVMVRVAVVADVVLVTVVSVLVDVNVADDLDVVALELVKLTVDVDVTVGVSVVTGIALVTVVGILVDVAAAEDDDDVDVAAAVVVAGGLAARQPLRAAVAARPVGQRRQAESPTSSLYVPGEEQASQRPPATSPVSGRSRMAPAAPGPQAQPPGTAREAAGQVEPQGLNCKIDVAL